MSSSSVDPDILAAYGGNSPASPPSHVDDDIAKAYGESPKASGPYDPDRPAIGDNLENQLHQFASETYHGIASGYKGLYTLATTQDPQKAAEAVRAEQAKTYVPPSRPQSPNVTPQERAAIQQGTTMQAPPSLGEFASSHGASPGLSTALDVLPTAAASLLAPRSMGTEEAPAFTDPQSMGAAHAPPDFSTADPDIQMAMAKLTPQEIEANRPVLERHAEAQSLPVKMRLTEGQATQDPDILSDEMNNRGATGLSKVLNTQGQQLKDNLQAIRENVGPDVFTTNPVEHGQTLIDAYKEMDAPVQADINAKYQALRDAAGGEIPIDGQAFVNSARTALRKQLLSNDVPPSIRSDMDAFASGDQMTFEDFESMRSKLAQEMRDNPSGNARTAAGIVRQSLEDLPLQGGAENLKPLADAARSAAKARFQAMEADPAYKAAVNDTVPPDQFVNKFVTGSSGSATKAQAAIMQKNLAGNPVATQTMAAATADELKKAALGVNGEGNFANTRYNNRLETLRPKLGSLLPPDAAEQATNLGKVARYIKAQPEGATINTSNTLTGAIAQGAGHLAKSVVNVKTGGLAGPVIDYVQGKLSARALNDKLETATAPLAGVKPREPGPTLQ